MEQADPQRTHQAAAALVVVRIKQSQGEALQRKEIYLRCWGMVMLVVLLLAPAAIPLAVVAVQAVQAALHQTTVQMQAAQAARQSQVQYLVLV